MFGQISTAPPIRRCLEPSESLAFILQEASKIFLFGFVLRDNVLLGQEEEDNPVLLVVSVAFLVQI